MSKSLKRVKHTLASARVDTDVIEMPASIRTAAEAAATVDCALDQIAKSVIFHDEDQGNVVLFITVGGNQVDLVRACALASGRLGKADAGLFRAQTGFAIGGVSLTGHLNVIRAWFDPRLSEFRVWRCEINAKQGTWMWDLVEYNETKWDGPLQGAGLCTPPRRAGYHSPCCRRGYHCHPGRFQRKMAPLMYGQGAVIGVL